MVFVRRISTLLTISSRCWKVTHAPSMNADQRVAHYVAHMPLAVINPYA